MKYKSTRPIKIPKKVGFQLTLLNPCSLGEGLYSHLDSRNEKYTQLVGIQCEIKVRIPLQSTRFKLDINRF